MKPKIDLKNPLIKLAIDAIQMQTNIALETQQTVEKAIIPIYALPKAKGHKNPKTKVEQYGSGVLVNIKEQYFILSSTHLFEAFDGYTLSTGDGKGSLLQSLSGERISSGHIESPYSNQLDATVFHVQSELSDSLKGMAIGLDDLEFEDDKEGTKPVYLAAGFRIKKSNTSGNQVKTKGEAFPSAEVNSKTYELYNIDKQAQFITSYEDDILVEGNWKKSPIPRGFSGGGLIKIEGTNILDLKFLPNQTKQKLRAIIIEHHRGKINKPGVLISTKINVHIGLIYKDMPELFDK